MENHDLPMGMDNASRFLMSLSDNLVKEHNIYCTKRIGENLTCKVQRVESMCGETFQDYYFSGQNLFYVEENVLYIVHPFGGHGTMLSALFNEWFYNGQFVTTDEMLCIVNEGLSSVNAFTLPDVFGNETCQHEIYYPCSHYFD